MTTELVCRICERSYIGRVGQRYCGRACQLEGARRAHYPEPEAAAQYRARLAAAAARRPDLAERWGVSV